MRTKATSRPFFSTSLLLIAAVVAAAAWLASVWLAETFTRLLFD
jgi:hypothetical protein